VDYRNLTDQGVRVEPPVPGEGILNSYVAHLKQSQNTRFSVDPLLCRFLLDNPMLPVSNCCSGRVRGCRRIEFEPHLGKTV
jgi:hypothetical protein